MKYVCIVLSLLSSIMYSQVLTPQGMETITATTELSKKENFDKISTYLKDYVINENVQITDVQPSETITLEGKQNNVACYINTKMGSKTCFELQFTMQVKTYDNGFDIDVIELHAVNDDMHPGKDYPSWFAETGEPYPMLKSCVDATSAYFNAYKIDFLDFIETGDYW